MKVPLLEDSAAPSLLPAAPAPCTGTDDCVAAGAPSDAPFPFALASPLPLFAPFAFAPRIAPTGPNKPSVAASPESPPSPSDDHNPAHETQAHVEATTDTPHAIVVTEQAKEVMERMAPASVPADSSMRSPAPPSMPEPPDEFVCPITTELMTDPVLATDGHTYERSAIECWFATGKTSSPKTGEPLQLTAVFPNHSVRSMIRDWEEVRRRLPV